VEDSSDAFYRLAPHLIDFGVDEEGIRTYAGRRFVFMDTNVFAKIFDNMEQVAGPVINSRIEEFGKKAGENIGAKMDGEFKETSKKQVLTLLWKSRFDIGSVRSLKPTDSRSQLQKIFGYGTFVGWLGETRIKEYEEKEKIRIKAFNTFESYSYGRTGRKECKFLLGVLEGLSSYFWDLEVEGEEVKCACESTDKDACVFQVVADES
jgi:predicted hydrocarbon binding protein